MRTGRWASHSAGVPELAGQRVASIAEDRSGRIWLATRHGGITVFDPDSTPTTLSGVVIAGWG